MSSGPSTSLHYAANSNFVNNVYAPGTDGFNLADVSSAAELNALPAGVKGLVWLGMTDGVTPAFIAAVQACIGNPNLYGFYLADEPAASPTIAANLKAEADYIKANVPGAVTFMVEQNLSSNTSPSYYYAPGNTDINLFGLDPYPVQTNVPNNLDYNIIPMAVTAAENAGVPLADIVPVYQAFGGGGSSTYILPTAAQEQQILATWASVVSTPAFDYAYSWGVQGGDSALSTDLALQMVFAIQNAPTGAAPPAPSFTAPANGGTDATTPTPIISGIGVAGDTVSLAINGATVAPSISIDGNGVWSYTAAPMANGSYTLTATQAVAGGPNSAAATIAFTINVGPPPVAPTITSPVDGVVETTTQEPETNTTAAVLTGEAPKEDVIAFTIGAAILAAVLFWFF